MKTAALIALALVAILAFKKPATPGERFIAHMNAYSIDSLDAMLANDFELSRTFVKLSHTKESFLHSYIPLTRRLHGRFVVTDKNTGGNPEEFWVEDHSVFFTFLYIPHPNWKLQVYKTTNNRIARVVIDTTVGYAQYVQTARFMSDQFEKWLKEAHPTESLNYLTNDTTSLYSKRLLEFRNKK